MTLGVGDLGASAVPEDSLVTHALGSCVAVVVRDRRRGVCGLAHVVVPSSPPTSNAVPKAGYYAPTAVAAVLEAGHQLGIQRDALEVVLVGGATAVDGLTGFDIGRRNLLAVRKALWSRGIVPIAEDVEGTMSRTVSVLVESGEVRVSNPMFGVWTLA
ncbi:MAG: chemotaxis protein CheD [Myxococcota bacterium]